MLERLKNKGLLLLITWKHNYLQIMNENLKPFNSVQTNDYD